MRDLNPRHPACKAGGLCNFGRGSQKDAGNGLQCYGPGWCCSLLLLKTIGACVEIVNHELVEKRKGTNNDKPKINRGDAIPEVGVASPRGVLHDK